MRLTMKGDYGLRAMVDLAAHFGQGPVPSADIATRQQVPEHFLDQVLILLRRAGLLKSLRGPQGGHMLARSPALISMGDVINALEGPTAPIECVPTPSWCQLSPGCGFRDILVQVDDFARNLFASTTLEQLAHRHRVATPDRDSMYYI
jgi:Rrf2 family transcriptional regulator, cysteine metabolism repressor